MHSNPLACNRPPVQASPLRGKPISLKKKFAAAERAEQEEEDDGREGLTFESTQPFFEHVPA